MKVKDAVKQLLAFDQEATLVRPSDEYGRAGMPEVMTLVQVLAIPSMHSLHGEIFGEAIGLMTGSRPVVVVE